MEKPSISDLGKLPRWALVAFAARCARRLDQSSRSFLDEQGRLASANAILLAERSAANARAMDVDDAIRAADHARRKEAADVLSRGDDTDYAREFSAPAEVASLAAQTVREPKPRTVQFIIDDVEYVCGANVRNEILRDYRLLSQAAVEQGWNGNTAVPPHFFAVGQNSAGLVLQAVRCLSDKLAQFVAEDPDALDAIEWRDLERMLASVFHGLGFEVELTPASKDGGKDIILRYRHNGQPKEYVIEVKHWRSRKHVGKRELTDFVKVVARERRDGGLFLATYGYSVDAIEAIIEIERTEIFMGEKRHIVALCRSYMRQNNDLWTPTAPLHEILHKDYRRLAVLN